MRARLGKERQGALWIGEAREECRLERQGRLLVTDTEWLVGGREVVHILTYFCRNTLVRLC